MLAGCENVSVLQELIADSLSCSKAGQLRWDKLRPGRNCGVCYPCLIRRAALHRVGLDDPQAYAYDGIGSPEILVGTKERGKDLRCVLQAVERHRRPGHRVFMDILKSGALSSVGSRTDSLNAVVTGFNELAVLIEEKGWAEVRQ